MECQHTLVRSVKSTCKVILRGGLIIGSPLYLLWKKNLYVLTDTKARKEIENVKFAVVSLFTEDQ